MTHTIAVAGTATMFAERSVEADGFDVRYYQAGVGEPLIVVHGAGGIRLTPALGLLARDFRVIAVELPGWGAEPNDRSQTLGDLAETVAAAADAIGADRYHVLGTSLGGAVALHLALRYPERVVSLILEAPAQFRAGARPVAEFPAAELVRAFRRHPERPPAWQQPDPRARSWPVVERVLARTPPYDDTIAEQMRQCPVRTLVLFGTKDGVIPPENGRTYRRLMPNCSLQYVFDAAHAIQEDRAEAFADITGDFLRRGMHYLIPDEDMMINP
jgi:pimeloyl-ACP methyl ester carboxylesterase